MNEWQTKAIIALEKQQIKVKPRSPQWMVGEQLKDICRQESRSAELILQDLQVAAAADPNVAEFKVRWAAWQEEYRKMMEVLARIAQANEEQAAKLRNAVEAALEQMGGGAA